MTEANQLQTPAGQRVPRLIWLLLGLHLALGALYSVVTPAWEAVDEPGHYQYVKYIAQQGALPPAGDPLLPRVGGSAGTQPPLYYLLVALPTSLVMPAGDEDYRLNRYAGAGSAEFGVNMVVHDFDAEAFPWSGHLLALHLARLVSVLLSTIGVWYVYLLARWLLPNRPAIVALATAIAALAPQYLFISAAVTNDGFVAALACVALYHATRLTLEPARLRDLAGLGIGLGLALLTKNTALGLLPIAAVALAAAAAREVRRGHAGRAAFGGLLLLMIVLGLAGWWIARNMLAYGAPLSRDQDTLGLLVAGLRQPTVFLAGIPWADSPGALWYGFQTFWAVFGWANVGLPAWIYRILAGICGIALLSCLLIVLRPATERRLRGAILFLGFGALVLTALPLGRELVRGQAALSGRFLFTTLPAVSLLLSIGLLWWLPRRLQTRAGLAISIILLACAIGVPFAVVRPAYARPPAPTSRELPAGASPLQITFADRAELYGYRIGPTTVPAGHAVGVTLYFKALRQNVENYAIGVYVFGPGGQDYGHVIRFPNRGNFATSLWQPGDLIEDTFWVPTVTDQPTPALGQIGVSMLLDADRPVRLGARDGQGRPLGEAPTFGRLKIAAPHATPIPLQPAVAIFGDQIAMTDVQWPAEPIRLGDTITVTARLQARRDLQDDSVFFVHLLNLANNRLDGDDAVPRAGEYPPGLWAAGEGSVESRSVTVPATIPPGKYQLALGIYRVDDGQRLPPTIGETGVPTGTVWYSPAFTVSR